MKKQPPVLNESRKFPDNMASAHALVVKAKRGEKGNTNRKGYAVPAFNVTIFQGINAAMKALLSYWDRQV